MIGVPGTAHIYLCCGVTDMRKGFDGLAALVQTMLRLSLHGGALAGRRKTFREFVGEGGVWKPIFDSGFVWTGYRLTKVDYGVKHRPWQRRRRFNRTSLILSRATGDWRLAVVSDHSDMQKIVAKAGKRPTPTGVGQRAE